MTIRTRAQAAPNPDRTARNFKEPALRALCIARCRGRFLCHPLAYIACFACFAYIQGMTRAEKDMLPKVIRPTRKRDWVRPEQVGGEPRAERIVGAQPQKLTGKVRRYSMKDMVKIRKASRMFRRGDVQAKLNFAEKIEALAEGQGGSVRWPGLGGDVVVTVQVRRKHLSPGASAATLAGVEVLSALPDDCDDSEAEESGAVRPSDDIGVSPEALALESALLEQGMADQRAVLLRPEMLTLTQACERSGIPVRTLTHMRNTGRLLALARSGALKGYRLPAWQFEQSVLESMPDIISAFGPHRAWQAYDFLTHSEPLLGGQVPLEELRRGRRDAVLRILPAVASLDQGAY